MIDRDGSSSLDDLRDLPHTTWVVRTPDGAELAVFRLQPGGDDHSRMAACPVVLAHCWTGDRRTWGRVARRLSAFGLDVVLYDHRGHGASSVGSAGCTIEAIGDDLAAVVEHVGADRVVLAGHSLGGMAIQSFAARHRELLHRRVAAVTLVATTSRKPRRTRGRIGPRVVGHPRLEKFMSRPGREHLAGRDFVSKPRRPEHLRAISETFLATPAPVRADFLSAFATMELSAGLRALAGMPVTVVAGVNDHFTPVAHARAMAAAVPGAQLIELPGVSHMLPFESTEFLAELLADTARAAAVNAAAANQPLVTEKGSRS